MEEQGKVAIITRTKNRPLLLERAFESVLNQTYTNWQMVVVNDGGEPEPVDRLAARHATRFAGRLKIIHNSISSGMEAASNKGISESESDYLIIHDDDDTWAPNFLLMSITELEKARRVLPSVRGSMCYSMQITERIEQGAVVIEDITPYNMWLPAGVLGLYRMAEGNVFPPISFLYRREALTEIGDYRADLPVLGDWEFNLRFMARYDITVIPLGLAHYHHRTLSSGDMGNSIYSGTNKHLLYDQFVRNELLRRDLAEGKSGIGLLVNESQRLGQVVGRLDALLQPAAVNAETATIGSQRWRATMYFASLLTFLRSKDKRTLIAKFRSHWENESPRRALEVMARYGYLALGGQ